MRSLNVLAAAGAGLLLAAVGCQAYRAPSAALPSRWLTGSRSAGIAVAPTVQVAAGADACAR
jgi:hypothetical protein